jgi:cytochrome c biogenesis protein CcdA
MANSELARGTLSMRAGVYAIFLLLGTGTLLPFNVFITERDFFEVYIAV